MKWLFPLLLTVLCVGIYDPTRWENTSGDTISMRYWPVAVLKHKSFTLNPIMNELEAVRYAAVPNNRGEWMLRGGLGMAVFSLPFYTLVHVLKPASVDWSHNLVNRVSRWNGILLATGAVLLLYFLLLNFIPRTPAFASSVLFAFGTWHWSLGAQGTGSQGAAVLLLLVCMWITYKICLLPTAKTTRKLAMGLGLCHLLLWAIRPQDLPLVLPALLVLWARRSLMAYFIAGLIPALLLAQLNYRYYGFYMGAYGLVESWGVNTFTFRPHDGFLGLLFSPNRGAIVFFPLLLLAPYLFLKSVSAWNPFLLLRRRTIPKTEGGFPLFYRVTVAGVILYFVELCCVSYWHGSWGYGPRYLYDLQPVFWPTVGLAIAGIFQRISGKRSSKHFIAMPAPLMVVFVLLGLQGIVIHALGHRNYDLYIWNSTVYPEVNNDTAWLTSKLQVKEIWEAGNNRHRWNDAYRRLIDYGF